MRSLATFALIASSFCAPAYALDVAASVKPIHSLVAGVMAGTGSAPELIVEGAASPHGFSMRPSDVDAIAKADVVFWVGESYETFLVVVLPVVAEGAVSIPLMDGPGLSLRPFRTGGLFEAESEGDEHGEREEHGHADEAFDPHIWLDPDIAVALIERIAGELSVLDPANEAAYETNAASLTSRIEEAKAEIAERLARLDGRYFVFHDAYQYFERSFGLEATGAFTINPAVAPGVQRLGEIKGALGVAGATCLFAEPQFSPAVIESLARDTGAKLGVLDPLGANLVDGPELYIELLHQLAGSFERCLA